MLIRLNNSFITRRNLINKCLMLSERDFLRIKRLRCEYRVGVHSRYSGEWRDLSYVRLVFELLMRLNVHNVEYSTISGYYNPNDPSSNEKKFAPGATRFSTLFAITTRGYLINSFFTNMYWLYNFHVAQIKQSFFHEKEFWEKENLERLSIGSDVDILQLKQAKLEAVVVDEADSSGLLKTFAHSRDFRLMALVDQNEGKEKERASILSLKDPKSNVSIMLHCFYFNFLPFSLKAGINLKRHFGIEFEFYIKEGLITDSLTLYNIIIFLTAMKMNWVWVEEGIIERFEEAIKK